jgi:hypothetical protein
MNDKKVKIQPGDIIEVVWRDAYSPTGEIWTTCYEVDKEAKKADTRMRACGYFVCTSGYFSCIASMWDFNPDSYECGKILYIPNSEIVSFKKIKGH